MRLELHLEFSEISLHPGETGRADLTYKYWREAVGRLSSHRIAANLTVAQLAERLDRSPSAIYALEGSDRVPSEEFILQYCRALRTSPSELLGWDSPASDAAVCDFFARLEGYSIREIIKTVHLDFEGNASVHHAVRGLVNLSSSPIRLHHKIQFGEYSEQASGRLIATATFAWGPLPRGVVQLAIPAPIPDPSNFNRAHIALTIPPAAEEYSYEFSYNCIGSTKMSWDAKEPSLEGAQVFEEWSQFHVEKPIKHLVARVIFPTGYMPKGIRAEVWKGNPPFRADVERLVDPEVRRRHVPEVSWNRDENCFEFSVDHAIHGLSYALVWQPIIKSELDTLRTAR